MQYRFFVNDVPVAASTHQLMEEYETLHDTEGVLLKSHKRTPMLKCGFHVDPKGYF